MAETLEKLVFELRADNAKLKKDLNRANKNTSDWASKTRSQVNGAAKTFGVVGAAGVGALSLIYTSAAESGDQLAKMSDKIGVLPEKLSALHHAAELTGVSVETTNMALQRMTRRVSEAGNGTGEAVKALAELGINAKELARQSPDEQFKRIATAMEGVENQGDKVRLSMKLFDSEGVSLVNTLALGRDGLEKMEAQAEALGLTLNRVDLAKMEAANDAFSNAKKITGGFGKQLAVQVSPLVKALADRFTDAAIESGGFGDYAKTAVDKVAAGVGFLADSVHGLTVIWDGVKAASLSAVGSILTGISWVDEKLSELINSVPGLEAQASASLQSSAKRMTNAGKVASENFQKALMKKLPSEKIQEFMRDAQEKAEVEAKAIAEKAPGKKIVSPLSVPIPNDDKADNSFKLAKLKSETAAMSAEYQHRRKAQADHHTILFNQYGTQAGRELALLQASIDEQRGALALSLENKAEGINLKRLAALENDKISQDQKILMQSEYFSQIELLTDQHNLKLAEVEQKGAAARAQIVEQERLAKVSAYTGLANGVLSIASAFGKKSVKQQKRMAVIQTGISIIAAAAKALNNPYPANLGFVAHVLAQGAALKSKLSSIGGGGGGSSPISSTPASASISSAKVSPVSHADKKDKKIIELKYYNPEGSIKMSDVKELLQSSFDDVEVVTQLYNTTERAKRVGAI